MKKTFYNLGIWRQRFNFLQLLLLQNRISSPVIAQQMCRSLVPRRVSTTQVVREPVNAAQTFARSQVNIRSDSTFSVIRSDFNQRKYVNQCFVIKL